MPRARFRSSLAQSRPRRRRRERVGGRTSGCASGSSAASAGIALGVALHRDLPMIQIADLTGVPGLSWLVAFANLMAVIIVRRIVGELGPVFLKRIRWEFSFTMALIVAGLRVSACARCLRNDAGPTVPLRVVAVQPNIPQTEKFDPRRPRRRCSRKLETPHRPRDRSRSRRRSSCSGRSRPRRAACLPSERNYRFRHRPGAARRLCAAPRHDRFRPADAARTTTPRCCSPTRGRRQQIYRKMHLVPFGEYLPLRPVFGRLRRPARARRFHARPRVHRCSTCPSPRCRFAALVCFEDTLGDLTRRFVQTGAQVLVNITNDGWFAQSPAAEQHLANAIFRAVENRRPLMRCGNTGVTCAVDPRRPHRPLAAAIPAGIRRP